MKQYNNYTSKDLTLVICAYGECEYLENAITSLLKQSEKSPIIISTSTNNSHINNIANKFNIPVAINKDGGQIKDYNFAMKQGNTPLIMLMHQDELLHKDFVKNTIRAINHAKDPIISFTNYIEMHNNIVDKTPSKMVKIKEMMLIPARSKKLMHTKFGKRLIQRLGDPITHPSVVCVKNKMPKTVYREKYKASMDWDLWERLSKIKGSFVYIPEVLLYHRMNDENQTVKLLQTSNARYEDEFEIFQRFWPKPIAKLMMKQYSKADKFY